MGPDGDVQACGVRLASALRALQTQGLFCDIAISSGSEQHVAHQVVLASRSKVLRDHILSQSRDQGSPAPELSMPPQPLAIRVSETLEGQLEACSEVQALLDRAYCEDGLEGVSGVQASQLSAALGLGQEASPLSIGLQALQAKGLLCDILLTVGAEHIPAHQVVLAATSSGLKRLILDGAKQLCCETSGSQASLPCNTFELEMRGIKHAEAIAVLVEFLYGSPAWTQHEVSSEVCTDILHLASELRLPKLQEQAMQWSRRVCEAEKGEAKEVEDFVAPVDSTEVTPPGLREETADSQYSQAEPLDGTERGRFEKELAQSFLSMRCIRFNSTKGVPQQPMMGATEAAEQAGEIHCRQDAAFLEKLVMLFWERPVWLESGLKHAPVLTKLMDADRLRRLLPFVAYQWKDGPWQQAYARLGWDPREEPEDSLKLQVILFKDTSFPGKGREVPEASDDIFFQSAPTRRASLYVLDVIEDGFIESLVQGAVVSPDRPECDRKTGFLGQVIYDAILDRLQVKATELRKRKRGGGAGAKDAPRKRARGG